MQNNSLGSEELSSLRQQNLISENEFAYRAGDLIVAENPTTGEKRVIGNSSLLKETNRRVLKG